MEVGLELGVAGELCYFADEIADGGEGIAEPDEFVVDGADGGGAVGVGAVEGEVGLVELSDIVAVFEEKLTAAFHVGFGFFDHALGEEFVDAQTCIVHRLAEAEGGTIVVGGGPRGRRSGGFRRDDIQDPAGDFVAGKVGGGLVEGGGIKVAGVVLSEGVKEPVVVQPLVGGDVDGAAESTVDDNHCGVGGDAAYVDDEGGEVVFTQEFFFQGLAGGDVQVGFEDVVTPSFDGVPWGGDEDGGGIEEGEVDGGPDEAEAGREALIGQDEANFSFELLFGDGFDGVTLGLQVVEGFLDVFVQMVRPVLEVIDFVGELEEAVGGLVIRDGRAVPGDGLDGPVPPLVEEVGGFPLEEAEAVGRGGEVGGRVAVSTLANQEEEEGYDDDGEGSFHGGWKRGFGGRISGGEWGWGNFVAVSLGLDLEERFDGLQRDSSAPLRLTLGRRTHPHPNPLPRRERVRREGARPFDRLRMSGWRSRVGRRCGRGGF